MESNINPERAYFGAGGKIGVGWTEPRTASPRRKTIQYESLSCTYDYATHVFTVEGPDGSMDFGVDALAELRAAMTAFGVGLAAGDTVNYR